MKLLWSADAARSLHKMVIGLHEIAVVSRCCQKFAQDGNRLAWNCCGQQMLPEVDFSFPVQGSFTTLCQFLYQTVTSSISLYSALMEFYSISCMITLSLYGTCICITHNIKPHHRMAYTIQQISLSQLVYCQRKMQQHSLTIIQYLLLKMRESYGGSWKSWEAW